MNGLNLFHAYPINSDKGSLQEPQRNCSVTVKNYPGQKYEDSNMRIDKENINGNARFLQESVAETCKPCLTKVTEIPIVTAQHELTHVLHWKINSIYAYNQ